MRNPVVGGVCTYWTDPNKYDQPFMLEFCFCVESNY